jgi:hypothetical protein
VRQQHCMVLHDIYYVTLMPVAVNQNFVCHMTTSHVRGDFLDPHK